MESHEPHGVHLGRPEIADNNNGTDLDWGLAPLSAFVVTLLNMCIFSWWELPQVTATPLSILGFLGKLVGLYVGCALGYTVIGTMCGVFLSMPIIVISNLILDLRFSLSTDRRWQELTVDIACFLGPWILGATVLTSWLTYAPQQLAPTATTVPAPTPGPTPTPIKRSIMDFHPPPERTPSSPFPMCDFNCEQYRSKTWDPYVGYDTLEYWECEYNEDRCVDAIISEIESEVDSWEQEWEPENSLPDLDYDYPENWY